MENLKLDELRIKTGFDSLDRRMDIFKSNFMVVASRPSQGTSSLVQDFTLNNIENGINVGYFSYEQVKEEFYARLASKKTRIPLTQILKGDLDNKGFDKVSDTVKEIKDKNNFTFYNCFHTLSHLINLIRKQHIIKDFDIIFIDYIQLIKSTATLEGRYLELNEISRELKLLAKELNILIVGVSKLNRNLESRSDKRPILYDLRDSGTIEDDADIVLFVYRDNIYKERNEIRKEQEARERGETYRSYFINKPIEETEIIFGKNRNGPVGTVKLDFHKEILKFVDKDYSNAPTVTTFESIDDIEIETMVDIPDI
jgi:replicative DNA helicase